MLAAGQPCYTVRKRPKRQTFCSLGLALSSFSRAIPTSLTSLSSSSPPELASPIPSWLSLGKGLVPFLRSPSPPCPFPLSVSLSAQALGA